MGARSNQPAMPSSTKKDTDKQGFEEEHHIMTPASTTSLHLELVASRFLLIAGSALVFMVVVMVVFMPGVVILHDVRDNIGSSTNAQAKVKKYQTRLGYLNAMVEVVREHHREIFLPVLATYLWNRKWFPGDRPRESITRVKQFVLFLFLPVLGIVLNIGFSGLYVGDETIGISRAFVDTDLVSNAPPSKLKTNNVDDTILRTAVMRREQPFVLLHQSPCDGPASLLTETDPDLSSNATQIDPKWSSAMRTIYGFKSFLPSVGEVERTSVVYGFPLKDWNYDLLPQAVESRKKLSFTLREYPSNATTIDKQFSEFQTAANLSLATAYDMILQGNMMQERSMSMGSTMEYDCTEFWNLYEANASNVVPNNYFAEYSGDGSSSDWGEEESDISWDLPSTSGDLKMCRGPKSSSLPLINQNADLSFSGFVDTWSRALGFNESLDSRLTFEVLKLSNWVQVTALTVDTVFGDNVGDHFGDHSFCGSSNVTDQIPPEVVKLLCDNSTYVYGFPQSMCGASNCVFMDFQNSLQLAQELLMFPFQSNCSTTKLRYNDDYGNWFPSDCQKQNTSMFLYGIGTYVDGERFQNGIKERMPPQIVKPRRHVVATFAKLDWKFDQMSELFGAECKAQRNCSGLVHELADNKGYLLVGEASLPAERMQKDFMDPIRLATLNTKAVKYGSGDLQLDWEFVIKSRFKSNDWAKNNTLRADSCSVLVDSYITHLEANHYYMEEPLQPLYTSAMYYLFQNGVVKQINESTQLGKSGNKTVKTTKDRVKLPPNVLAYLSLNGDREIKRIEFSIPLQSAIASFVGMFIMLVLTVLMFVYPQDRLQLPNGPTAAIKFIDSLTNETYPEQIHHRHLRLPNGHHEDTEEYTVANIQFVHEDHPGKKVNLGW